MAKSNGNMYEFVSKTWNPLAGECLHACGYCSTNSFRKRFEKMREKYSGKPRIIESEMKKRFSEKDTVFVVAQNDLFAENVPENIITQIVGFCNINNKAKYIFQTKNPERLASIIFPENSEIGITLESDIWHDVMQNSPSPTQRVKDICLLEIHIDFVTIEPIFKFSSNFVNKIRQIKPKYVNIGADSSHGNYKEPSKEEILQLICELETFTTVKQKSNLKRLLK